MIRLIHRICWTIIGIGLIVATSWSWAQQRKPPTPPALSSGTPSSEGRSGDSYAPSASWRNAPQSYIIQPGDTLWDISRRFLGNPWYWPKLWSKNPQIQNPHWIFPGNTLRFSTSGEMITSPKEEKDKKKEWGDITHSDTKKRLDSQDISVTGRIVSVDNLGLLGKTMLQHRESFIDLKGIEDSGKLVGSSEKRMLLTSRDSVYLRFKNLRNVRIGEQYSIYRQAEGVRDPSDGKLMGYIVRLVGIVQITEIRENLALGNILEAFREIQKEDLVGRYIHHKVKITIRRNESLVKGHIMRAVTSVSLYGQFFQIYLNRGSRHGLRDGNTVSIYRRGGLLRDQVNISARNKWMREFIGLAVIIEVRRDTSVAVVTRSSVEVLDGDEIETSLSD